MPSLGIITLNALTAADKVIIPVQAQFLPTKGRHPRDKKNHDDGNEGIGSGEGEDQQSWRNKAAEEKILNRLIKKG